MPLLSLIEDNFNFVKNLGIPAVSLSIHNKFDEKRVNNYLSEIRNLQYKLVYLTPEKLVNSSGLTSTLQFLYKQKKINWFVIDEVHCVSHWGQDFRADYLNLDVLKTNFPSVPILGLTATATLNVKEDIVKRLKLNKPIYFQSSFNRPNLLYEIKLKKTCKNIENDLVNLLQNRFKNKSGIIYCQSRKDCEQLCEKLSTQHLIKCSYYHAELDTETWS